MDSFEISEIFKVKASKIYEALMDSKKHSDFTGTKCEIEPVVNGKFNVWDDYITGTNVELIPDKKIVQNWRTTEFSEQNPDSLLEIILEEVKGGTKLTLKHSNIPTGQGDNYKQGWKDFYFEPLKRYFS